MKTVTVLLGDLDVDMTPEAEASYAIGNGIPRSNLSMGAQLVYDQMLAQRGIGGQRSSVYAVPPPSAQLPSNTDETHAKRMETYAQKTMIYAHQTAVATQFIAWIIAIGVILAVISGIIAGINLVHIANQTSQGNLLP
jgi:hypothetical protein